VPGLLLFGSIGGFADELFQWPGQLWICGTNY